MVGNVSTIVIVTIVKIAAVTVFVNITFDATPVDHAEGHKYVHIIAYGVLVRTVADHYDANTVASSIIVKYATVR